MTPVVPEKLAALVLASRFPARAKRRVLPKALSPEAASPSTLQADRAAELASKGEAWGSKVATAKVAESELL